MDRLTLFKRALAEVEGLRARFPDLPTIVSIIRQLQYLIALESGQTTDRSRLADIIVGVQAAREIEPLDLPTAETLYDVADQAKIMNA